MSTVTQGVVPPITISVSNMVAESIKTRNPTLAQHWLRLCCKNIIDGFPVNEQLEYISDFWRLRMSYFQADTMDPRSSMNANLDVRQWMDNFNHDILPLIATHWNGR